MFAPESEDQSAIIATKGNDDHDANNGQMSKIKQSISETMAFVQI